MGRLNLRKIGIVNGLLLLTIILVACAPGSLAPVANNLEPAAAPVLGAKASSDTQVEFVGLVTSVTDGQWTVADKTVAVGPDTEVASGIGVGDLVKVEADSATDGVLMAREIKGAITGADTIDDDSMTVDDPSGELSDDMSDDDSMDLHNDDEDMDDDHGMDVDDDDEDVDDDHGTDVDDDEDMDDDHSMDADDDDDDLDDDHGMDVDDDEDDMYDDSYDDSS
ncbi:MAG: DUF5666 domain-containing protein, partial [Candidatus Promineifilaceae bacterium]